jgi:hypothetical protein
MGIPTFPLLNLEDTCTGVSTLPPPEFSLIFCFFAGLSTPTGEGDFARFSVANVLRVGFGLVLLLI